MIKQEANWRDKFIVTKVEEPRTWRLLKAKVDGNPDEEMVFTIHGILVSKALPPLTVKPR